MLQEYLELQPAGAFKAFISLVQATSMQEVLVDAIYVLVTTYFERMLQEAESRKQAALQALDDVSGNAEADVDHLAALCKEEVAALLEDNLTKCPNLSFIKHLYAIAGSEGSPIVGSSINGVIQANRPGASGTAVWLTFQMASLVYWRRRISKLFDFKSSIELWEGYFSESKIKLHSTSPAFRQDYLDNDLRRRQQSVQLKEVHERHALAWPPAITEALEKLRAEIDRED